MSRSSTSASTIYSVPRRNGCGGNVSPRKEMAERIPRPLQPLLTWITAQPVPGEREIERSGSAYVWDACARTAAGVLLAIIPFLFDVPGAVPLVISGWLLSSSGLGLFQVVVFHHCAHGTVFRRRELNRGVGRLVSAVLLFKYFDLYQREHMLHHSPRKLLTEEDEFADFIFGVCRLRPGMNKDEMWRRIITAILSPRFHAMFLWHRVRSSLGSPNRLHNAIGMGAWGGAFACAAAAGQLTAFVVAWVFPVTVLLQVATVFRILCEHRFPDPDLIATRGKAFMCHATAGVFPGAALPARRRDTLRGLIEWSRWWAEMLFVHGIVRLFVLVGDAPCHDYHHRHPASRKWTTYIQARQRDRDLGCPGFPVDYIETWGLFRAIDENLASLATAHRDLMGTRERLAA